MNQTATVSHQVKCQSTKTIKVRLPAPLSRALINFCCLWQLCISSELGCRVSLCALTRRAPEPKRLPRGALKLQSGLVLVPRLHWARLRRELRSFTPGVLDEELRAGAVSSFHSDHVVFSFPFPRVKCSRKVSPGPFDGALVAQVCRARRDSPLAPVLFELWLIKWLQEVVKRREET